MQYSTYTVFCFDLSKMAEVYRQRTVLEGAKIKRLLLLGDRL